MEESIEKTLQAARQSFRAGRLSTYEQRYHCLQQIDKFLVEQEGAILAAVKKDLRKPVNEGLIGEVYGARAEVCYAMKNLKSWMKSKPVPKQLALFTDKATIQPQPYGVVLLIVPWNYPFYLLFMPLIGAIAAGNCVVIKPSEMSQASEQLVKQEFHNYLPEDCFPIVSGGVPVVTCLLEKRFDYIFYTGSTPVGKLVMKAAANFLTPVTLELGGKCPTWVDASSDMGVAANRIIANKCLNAGQACISHDYILCTRETQEKLIPEMQRALEQFYGKDMQGSADFARIINERHFQRLQAMNDTTKGRVIVKGNSDKEDLFIGLSIYADVGPDDSTLQDEIFGPILPIVTVKNFQEGLDFINAREKPLAAYVFAQDKSVIAEFERGTTSGAMVANDSTINMAVHALPFGGVGESGIGAYHGKLSFDTFTHKRAVLIRDQGMDKVNVALRYPPFAPHKTKRLLQLFFTTNSNTDPKVYLFIVLAVIVAVAAAVFTQWK